MRPEGPSRDDLEGILVRPPDQGCRRRPWTAPPRDAVGQLVTMAGLHERGLLSRPEFETQKARILRHEE